MPKPDDQHAPDAHLHADVVKQEMRTECPRGLTPKMRQQEVCRRHFGSDPLVDGLQNVAPPEAGSAGIS